MADLTFRAFAGLRNTLDAERLEPADLSAAVNIDLDDSGRAARRAGSTLRVPGAAHSLWADGDTCLYVSADELRRLQPDFSSQVLANGLTPDLPAAYVRAQDRIYWSNGAQTGVVADARARAWGIPLPAAPAATASAGTLTAGRYQYALTWLRADGLESGAGLPATIDLPAGSGVTFAWTPPADPALREAVLYLSEPNGMVLYRALTVPAAAARATFTGGLLATPLDTQWLDAPPPGQCLALSRGRIYIGAGAFVYGTAPLSYEHCDLRDYLALDDSPVRFVLGVDGGLYVGTARAVHFASGARLDEMTRRTVVPAAAVAGSAVLADGFAALGNAELAGQQIALFATAAGIVAGLPDGTVLNLSAERYRFAASAAGAALFRHADSRRQYLLFLS